MEKGAGWPAGLPSVTGLVSRCQAEWKGGDMPLEDKYAKYEEALSESADLVPQLSGATRPPSCRLSLTPPPHVATPHVRARASHAAALLELEPLIFSAEYCTEGGLSYDDIDLWARCDTAWGRAHFGASACPPPARPPPLSFTEPPAPPHALPHCALLRSPALSAL